MRGRKPAPTKLRLLKNNPSGRPIPQDRARPPANLPTPPPHLTDAAKAEWKRKGNELLKLGLITAIDTSAFAVYCQAYARWAEAEEKLKQASAIIPTPSGFLQQSPYLAIANKAQEQMMKALIEFGMTPSSRTRVSAAPTAADADPLAEFIGGNS